VDRFFWGDCLFDPYFKEDKGCPPSSKKGARCVGSVVRQLSLDANAQEVWLSPKVKRSLKGNTLSFLEIATLLSFARNDTFYFQYH
jgi:hypothetical protein